MCDMNLKIMDVVARWPGSCHDSTIFSNSRICARFESTEFGDAVIVGDGGYPCKSYLMIPLRSCDTQAQHEYNKAHILTRTIIERVFGIWKRRFPALALGLRLKLNTVQIVVIATAILHNICCNRDEIELPELDDFIDEQVRRTLNVGSNEHFESVDGTTRRLTYIDYFRVLAERIPNQSQ